MSYNFDECIPRAGTRALKYDEARAINPYLPEDFIPLWVADMDFACAPSILRAMRARLEQRILGYTTIDDAAYTDSVTGWMRRRFDWSFGAEQIVFSSGVVTALHACVELLTKPGDAVLIMTPAYSPFDAAVKRFSRTPLYSRLLSDGRGCYTIDFTDLEQKACRSDCRLLFLCSPQNPTGRVWTEDELRKIGEICFANDVFVVCDEIHADLVRTDVKHIPIAKLFPNETRIITCTSPSKTFNIAGNRHSNLIVPCAKVRKLLNESSALGHPGALSAAAVVAAYNECEDWLDELKLYLDGSFEMMKKTLSERLPKAIFRVPEGTYLGWVNLSALGPSQERLNELVSRAGVFVQFGGDFVENGDGCMRVNIACPRALLAEGLDRICGALETYR